MKKVLIYILAFVGGGLFGMAILPYVPDALSFLSNGLLNFPIFGAVGFGIAAVAFKQYKLLLLVPVIAFLVGLGLLVLVFWGG